MSDERRLVTVVFADVVGSTALGSEVDPEDLRVLLADYFALAREIVDAHGGTLEKFIGDAVMAIFGLPQAHDDDPARAVSAAIELRDRLQDDKTLGERLPVRIGINTGEVVAGRDAPATGDFLVTGDAVNVAARLQQAAEPWAILAGERTVRAARSRFEFAPAVRIEAKGKPTGIVASEVRRRAAGGQQQFRIPFVGRDSDLAQLELIAERTFTERQPSLVSVIAPAGTGKSRLLEEFLDRLRTTHSQAAIAMAQCLPYGQRLTYWPLRSLLLALLGLDEASDSTAVRDALKEWLAKAGVEGADDLVRLVGATIGLGEIESGDRAALLAAWRTVIETAARRPLVLVVEDLHWSSDSLLELFEFVLQPRGDAPVMIVALARPELLDRRPTWGGGRRNHLSLALAPLPDRSVEQLVRELLPGATPEVVDGVVRRAEGNPFYAGEIVGSLLERAGSLDEMARIEEALASLPDTVHGTVLARIDLLTATEREVLKVGSIFGRSFRLAGVRALVPAIGEEAINAAERLSERDLIRPAGGDGFAFRHILIREVAYQTLPRAERAKLHAAAARWLEERSPEADAVAELIAFHYREAATLGRSLSGVVDEAARGRAVEWLERAANVARAGAASIEASAHLRAAIELADEARLPDLYERLGEVDLSGPGRVRAFERARQLAAAQARPANQRLRIIAHLLLVYVREQGSVATRPSGDYIEGLRHEARQLLPDADDAHALARYHIAEGFLPWSASAERSSDPQDLVAGERAAQVGLAIAKRVGDLQLTSIALDALSALAQERGDWRLSERLSRRRLDFGTQFDLVEVIDAHAMVVWDDCVLGNLAEAERVAAAGMALLQPGQIPPWALHLAAWRTLVLRLLGNWDVALHVADQARRLWLESGRPSAGYATRGFAAACDIARARGDTDTFDRYRAVVREIRSHFPLDDPQEWSTHYVDRNGDWLATVAADPHGPLRRRPEIHAAVLGAAVDEGIALPVHGLTSVAAHAARQNARLLEAHAHRALAAATSDSSHLDHAVAIFGECGARPALGRSLVERGIATDAHADVEAGRVILQAISDVEQLDRYAAISRYE